VTGDRADRVVLLHGMGRTWRSMSPIGRACERAGFTAINIGYPGTRRRLAEIVEACVHELTVPRAAGRMLAIMSW